MSFKDRVLKAIGLGQNRPEDPVLPEASVSQLSNRIETEVKKLKEIQTDLQCRTLDDISSSVGIRNAVRGVLENLERTTQR